MDSVCESIMLDDESELDDLWGRTGFHLSIELSSNT